MRWFFRQGGLPVSRVAVFASILSAVFAACSSSQSHVGFVGPLTGSSSAIGLGCRNGFLMAFGEGPGAAPGSIPALDLVVKDDMNDPAVCLRDMKELKASGCQAVILGTPSQAATEAVPWAVANGMLVITPTVSSPIRGDDSPLFIRVNMPSSEYGRALARTAVERFHVMRMGVVGDSRNSSYVDTVDKAFIDEYEGLGGKTSFVRSFDSAKEKPQEGLAAAIRSSSCEGLLVIAASTEVVLVAKELDRAGLHTQLFLPPWPLTLDLIRNGGTAVEGAVAVSIADLEFRSPAGKAFEAAYRDDHGEEPSFTAMFGWEAASILRAAIASGGRKTAMALRDRILALRSFDGLQGKIEFDSRGRATRTMFLFRIEGGSFKRID
ncbi:MAG TPA: ABC transporter substrate-binding protein [Rectinemataceae bacterium]|nr:ABC transporter substrate-binding protein [Rectinemataceae bacterium]